ncbi:acyl-CoA thioesterase [Varunaivibrio sulfuroxidans]|nr:acyl-CoA thioesterase [Varunaivibrio sulfuroxidans]WES31247.1 acyl-CoA thioesterase [Varunaivibrio sulfuroxidans]
MSNKPSSPSTPHGVLAIRTLAMPANTNTGGNIFGGWLLSQMDVAGGITAAEFARGRVATVAINAMEFHCPVLVGDVLSCHVDIVKVGRTSLKTHVEAWVKRLREGHVEEIKVTEGDFVFVALNAKGEKRVISQE